MESGNINIENVRQFLYREARLLDEKKWEEWLDCYDENCPFWMPSWDDDGELVTDPQREISLIYYPDRGGLEDRVFRIETERSAATIPDTRTSHNLSNIEILEQDKGVVLVRFNWLNKSFRYNQTNSYWGFSKYKIDMSGETPKILDKYVVLKNDYVHQLIDVYHI
ncbi:benzoate 1,2-dioxygenase small subunit [Psychrobacter piechaudii]|uniref:2-halobenzoate 1,2-dioxygenase small subunit n=1 Tax=Psychrobacter piechaudii TaxID=1945521 RepID=A0A1R4GXZ2_9GAMM|nr:benzoate 1,2-dioxygenase small subunit [Psychrobacter piechaudii]SJM73004.1 2-halobenzoate 1,2-dioxygenase small subunit [Psychrobacter piechaudii]